MAADQRKKRLNASSITSSSRDQYKFKRKKLGLPQYDLDMRSYISLEWDDGKKSVVAKREQIGISRRELIPFIDVRPPGHNVLADVITVPREIFGLENLAKVLTYEVWQAFLYENERSLLAQFLPKGADPDEVVQELLGGDNFHFGNPFLKWGSLLCSGNYHPDNIVHSEQCFKASKKAYYMDLRKYHNDMVENLQLWKERLASCEDPEEEILIWRKGSTSSALDNSSDGVKIVAKSGKGEKLLKLNIQHGDGAKYMSYIKVSKAQHQRVKSSMKHNSNSIQPKSLNNVLGNIEALHVQPFEVYEEEVRRRLHDHWLQLATRDLPAGFANWRERQLQRLQLTKSLGLEMETKLKSQIESADQGEEKESSHDMSPETMDDEDADTDDTSTMMKEAGVAPNKPVEAPLMTVESEKQESDGSVEEQMDSGSANGEQLEPFEDKERDEADFVPLEQSDTGTTNSGNADNSVLVPTENEHLQHTVSSNDGPHHHQNMNIASHGDHFNETTEEASPDKPEYPENLSNVDVPMNQEDTLTSNVNTWQQVGMPGSYYNSTSLNHEYSSASELSLGHQQVEEQPTQLINLEADHREKDVGKDILQRHPDDMSFFNLYPHQDRNELLHSFFKSQSNLPYQHEQKETDLEFQPAANLMIETGQFPGHMREHVHSPQPLELRQKGLSDFYMHQNVQESMYSDGGRFNIDRQENLPLNVQDWAVNTVRMSAPPQSHGNGSGLLSQNWFSGENQARGSWSCMEGTVVPSQNIGSGSNSDQSLFSVLSECSELRRGAAYDSMNSTGRFMQSGNYGGVSGGIHTASNVLQQTSNPLSYLSGHEAAAGFKTNSLGWMNAQHQTPTLEETMAKPFLRSWNQ